MTTVQRLYLLLPNHKCPNKKNCPFHPPEEEEEELEEAEMTLSAKPRAMSLASAEDKVISEQLLAQKLSRINQEISSNLLEGHKLHLPRKTSHDISLPSAVLDRLRAEGSLEQSSSSSGYAATLTLGGSPSTREESVTSDVDSMLDSGFTLDSCSDREMDGVEEEVTLPLIQEEVITPEISEEFELKDGKEVPEDDRHRTTYKEGEATLQITDLATEDEGAYTCQAVNELGEAETSASLTVEEVRHRRKRLVEDEATVRLKRPAHEYDMTDLDTNVAPDFTLPLVDQSRAVGEEVTFTVTVTCRPEPDVTWYHGDEKVTRSDRIALHHDKGVYRLVVLNLKAEDAGEWRCHAYSSYGEAWCSCDLTVIESIPEGHSRPRFTKELEYMTASEGSLVRLDCAATGDPAPTMKWFKDRRRIDTDGHYKVRTTADGSSTLVIEGVQVEDTGCYMCVAENDAGTSSTEARIKVQKIYDTRPTYEMTTTPLGSVPLSDQPGLVKKQRVEVAPDFTAKLKNKFTQEGATVRLNCSVTGIPEPLVRWFRDGKEIFDGHDYTMRNNYGLLSLEVVYAKPSLAGTYSVEASNSEGTVSCSCTLEVEGEEELESIELDILRPKFLKVIEDITVMEGADAAFHCVGTGKPMPVFKWQRDMVNISGSKRAEMEYDNQGHASLVLHKVKPSDAGLYFCTAQSRSGRAKCSAYLHVKAKSPSPLATKEATEYTRVGGREVRSLDRSSVGLGAPPTLSLMLPKTLDVAEGERLKLDCSVQGLPVPLVTWHKGDRELIYSQRHRIILCGTLHTMEIPSVMSLDKGEYIVRATNAYGTIESSCQVNILPKGERVRTPPDYRREAMREAAKLSSQAPFFIKHLPRSIDVMAGVDVRLDCILRRGIELVRWSSSQSPPPAASEKTKELVDEGYHGEFIPMHREEDKDTSKTTAATGREADGRLEHPSFSSTPSDLTLPVGSDAVFECSTAGTPDPEVKWYKDGRVLISSDSVRMTSTGNKHRLKIKAIIASDEGEYTCKAKSLAGTKTCGAVLTLAVDSSTHRPSSPHTVEEEEQQPSSSSHTETTPASRPEKASFSEPLPKTTDGISGETVVLSCRVSGDMASVQWELNNKELPKDPRYSVSWDRESSQHQLTIQSVATMDAAKYTCVVRLTDGDLIHTSTKLNVTEVTTAADTLQDEEEKDFKPRFETELKDTSVRDGQGLLLECDITGNPRPQISWFRDGVEIFDSQDFQISMIGTHCKLQVADIYPEDEGEYSCTAVNSLGEATSCCYVAVEDSYMSADSASTTSSRSYDKTRGKRGETIGDGKKKSKKEKETPEVAPEFVVKPRRQFLSAGEEAKFKASFDGSPSTTLFWSKDGQVLCADGHYKIFVHEGYHHLEIDSVTADDVGQFTCTVQNSAGSASASADLEVFDKPKLLSREAPPDASWEQPLKDVTAHEGELGVELCCVSQDLIRPSATWYHNGRQVFSGFHMRLHHVGQSAALMLKEVLARDEGDFRCVMAGGNGSLETSCHLTVLPPEKLEPPVFVKELRDMEVEDGDKLELVVEVKGTNPIDVLWYHNNAEVTPDNPHFLLASIGHVHTLTLPRASVECSGQFVCEAYNTCGDTDTFCLLDVKEVECPEAPTFLTRPLTLLAHDGDDSATFTCMVKGRPTPSVMWEREGVMITPSHKYKTTRIKDQHSLAIFNVDNTDTGEYTCHLHNSIGDTCHTCVLEVHPQDTMEMSEPVSSVRVWCGQQPQSRSIVTRGARKETRITEDSASSTRGPPDKSKPIRTFNVGDIRTAPTPRTDEKYGVPEQQNIHNHHPRQQQHQQQQQQQHKQPQHQQQHQSDNTCSVPSFVKAKLNDDMHSKGRCSPVSKPQEFFPSPRHRSKEMQIDIGGTRAGVRNRSPEQKDFRGVLRHTPPVSTLENVKVGAKNSVDFREVLSKPVWREKEDQHAADLDTNKAGLVSSELRNLQIARTSRNVISRGVGFPTSSYPLSSSSSSSPPPPPPLPQSSSLLPSSSSSLAVSNLPGSQRGSQTHREFSFQRSESGVNALGLRSVNKSLDTLKRLESPALVPNSALPKSGSHGGVRERKYSPSSSLHSESNVVSSVMISEQEARKTGLNEANSNPVVHRTTLRYEVGSTTRKGAEIKENSRTKTDGCTGEIEYPSLAVTHGDELPHAVSNQISVSEVQINSPSHGIKDEITLERAQFQVSHGRPLVPDGETPHRAASDVHPVQATQAHTARSEVTLLVKIEGQGQPRPQQLEKLTPDSCFRDGEKGDNSAVYSTEQRMDKTPIHKQEEPISCLQALSETETKCTALPTESDPKPAAPTSTSLVETGSDINRSEESASKLDTSDEVFLSESDQSFISSADDDMATLVETNNLVSVRRSEPRHYNSTDGNTVPSLPRKNIILESECFRGANKESPRYNNYDWTVASNQLSGSQTCRDGQRGTDLQSQTSHRLFLVHNNNKNSSNNNKSSTSSKPLSSFSGTKTPPDDFRKVKLKPSANGKNTGTRAEFGKSKRISKSSESLFADVRLKPVLKTGIDTASNNQSEISASNSQTIKAKSKSSGNLNGDCQMSHDNSWVNRSFKGRENASRSETLPRKHGERNIESHSYKQQEKVAEVGKLNFQTKTVSGVHVQSPKGARKFQEKNLTGVNTELRVSKLSPPADSRSTQVSAGRDLTATGGTRKSGDVVAPSSAFMEKVRHWRVSELTGVPIDSRKAMGDLGKTQSSSALMTARDSAQPQCNLTQSMTGPSHFANIPEWVKQKAFNKRNPAQTNLTSPHVLNSTWDSSQLEQWRQSSQSPATTRGIDDSQVEKKVKEKDLDNSSECLSDYGSKNHISRDEKGIPLVKSDNSIRRNEPVKSSENISNNCLESKSRAVFQSKFKDDSSKPQWVNRKPVKDIEQIIKSKSGPKSDKDDSKPEWVKLKSPRDVKQEFFNPNTKKREAPKFEANNKVSGNRIETNTALNSTDALTTQSSSPFAKSSATLHISNPATSSALSQSTAAKTSMKSTPVSCESQISYALPSTQSISSRVAGGGHGTLGGLDNGDTCMDRTAAPDGFEISNTSRATSQPEPGGIGVKIFQTASSGIMQTTTTTETSAATTSLPTRSGDGVQAETGELERSHRVKPALTDTVPASQPGAIESSHFQQQKELGHLHPQQHRQEPQQQEQHQHKEQLVNPPKTNVVKPPWMKQRSLRHIPIYPIQDNELSPRFEPFQTPRIADDSESTISTTSVSSTSSDASGKTNDSGYASGRHTMRALESNSLTHPPSKLALETGRSGTPGPRESELPEEKEYQGGDRFRPDYHNIARLVTGNSENLEHKDQDNQLSVSNKPSAQEITLRQRELPGSEPENQPFDQDNLPVGVRGYEMGVAGNESGFGDGSDVITAVGETAEKSETESKYPQNEDNARTSRFSSRTRDTRGTAGDAALETHRASRLVGGDRAEGVRSPFARRRANLEAAGEGKVCLSAEANNQNVPLARRPGDLDLSTTTQYSSRSRLKDLTSNFKHSDPTTQGDGGSLSNGAAETTTAAAAAAAIVVAAGDDEGAKSREQNGRETSSSSISVAPETTTTTTTRGEQDADTSDSDRDHTVPVRECLPDFLTPPSDVCVMYGSRATLRCRVTGNPAPVVEWLQDQTPIQPCNGVHLSSSITTTTDDDTTTTSTTTSSTITASLTLCETFTEHIGTYTCVASNALGSVSAHCRLTLEVSNKSEGLAFEGPVSMPAKIVSLTPKTVSLRRGSPLTLTVTFIGEPAPTVQWLQGKRHLRTDSRVAIQSVDKTKSELTIAACDHSDDGSISALVSNSLGTDQSSVVICVEDVPGAPVGQPHVYDITARSASLSWCGPTPEARRSVTHYVIEVKTRHSKTWDVIVSDCKELSYHIRDLQASVTYQFRVLAANEHGLGRPSAPSERVITSDPFRSPIDDMSDDDLPFEPREVQLNTTDKFEDLYDLDKEVGKGKFGVVYKCQQKADGTVWAAKIVKCREKEKAAIRQEMEIMNLLRHPKLLMLWDAFESPRRMVLVMEYVGAGELFERVIGEDFVLTERDCVHFLRQICEGVAYMHAVSVLHLDLKPENILCMAENSNRIKIIDFGLARIFKPDESLKVMFGTPEFIAPEVINYDQIGYSTDMWSVGVICYVLLSGLSPFLGDNDAETLANVTSGEFDFDDEAFDEICDDAKEFISSLLLKKKEKRLMAEQCMSHKWLVQDEVDGARYKRLNTDRLKRFMVRRKWLKTGNAVLAVSRLLKTSMGSFGRTNSDSSLLDSPVVTPRSLPEHASLTEESDLLMGQEEGEGEEEEEEVEAEAVATSGARTTELSGNSEKETNSNCLTQPFVSSPFNTVGSEQIKNKGLNTNGGERQLGASYDITSYHTKLNCTKDVNDNRLNKITLSHLDAGTCSDNLTTSNSLSQPQFPESSSHSSSSAAAAASSDKSSSSVPFSSSAPSSRVAEPTTAHHHLSQVDRQAGKFLAGAGSENKNTRPGNLPSPLVFTKKMKDCKACAGDVARFDVVLSGHPWPQLYWYFEDELLLQDSRHIFEVNVGTGTCSLIVRGIEENDEGEYTFKGVNSFGEVMCSAELSVLEL